MIKKEDIYSQTNGGLDIVASMYPQARECAGTKKKFSMRPGETDASTTIHYSDKAGCWMVHDFGGDDRDINPIDLYMDYYNVEFPEAVLRIASEFGVEGDGLSRSVNRPDIRFRAPKPEEDMGLVEIEELTDEEGRPAVSETHLQVMGPRVTREIFYTMGWMSLKEVRSTGMFADKSTGGKRLQTMIKMSTENYPIFARRCAITNKAGLADGSFYKIYEPLNPDKQYRFTYFPVGGKPSAYIHGLHELRQRYLKYNEQEEASLKQEGKIKEDGDYIMQKLEEATICCGERDALCCRAAGYNPIWFNSETYNPTDADLQQIYRYVKRIYSIPDADSTGVRKGRELALRHRDIFTIWLPGWLSEMKDRRGKPRKDLRDFVEVRPRFEDLKKLYNIAMPAQFWEWKAGKDSMRYEINTSYLHYFLSLHGFHVLKDPKSRDARFVRVTGNVVSEIRARDILPFLKKYTVDECLPIEIRNAVLNSPRTSESCLSMLDPVELDFTSYTTTSQLLFFENDIWEVTGAGIRSIRGAHSPEEKEAIERWRSEHPKEKYRESTFTTNNMIWESNLVKHKVSRQNAPFAITEGPDLTGETVFDIDIRSTSSNFFCYLINSSRIYWRKELEQGWEPAQEAEAEAYRARYKFAIDGPRLDPAEVKEQKQHLVNKIFAIGYMMHKYKTRSRAWAPYVMDALVDSEGKANGRSGKSCLFNAIAPFVNKVVLNGRDTELMRGQFPFERVTDNTDLVYVDDMHRGMKVDAFYSCITEGLVVNPKNNNSFFMDFSESPKFAFSTNYPPSDFDPSSTARLLYMVYSDYYHKKSDGNDYLETRSISDDFGGRDLFDSLYSEAEWDADLNFMACCLRFYLFHAARSNTPIQPPLGNIITRKLMADMGEEFSDWAETYFAENGEHIDEFLPKNKVYETFLKERQQNAKFWPMIRFTKACRAFANLHAYIYEMNPEHLCGKDGRIQKKVDGQTTDMIYMMSLKEAEKYARAKEEGRTPEVPQPADPEMPF